MAKGTNKPEYAWEVKEVSTGNVLESGGYKGDGDPLHAEGTAISQALACINGNQRRGKDSKGEIFYRVAGVDATVPETPLPAALRNDQSLCKVDAIERGVHIAIAQANKDMSGANALPPLSLPQEVAA